MSTTANRGEITNVILLEDGAPIAFADPTTFTVTGGRTVSSRQTLGTTDTNLTVDPSSYSLACEFPEITPALADLNERYQAAVEAYTKTNIAISVTYRYPETGESRTATYTGLAIDAPSRTVARSTDTMMSLTFTCGTKAVWT